MQLNNHDIYFLTQCAISAAYKAGIYISKQVNEKLTIQTKSDKESLASQVFTQVDLESQSIILNTLKPTIDYYNLGLLCEESLDDGSRFTKPYFWAIDPLDGTLPFLNKQHGYAVAIALVDKHGSPIIGVVYDPLKQTIYYASVNNGTFINNQKLTLKDDEDDTTLHLYLNQSFTAESHYQSIISEIEEILPQIGCKKIEIYAIAGAAMNACMVLEHKKACYFKFPKKGNSGGAIWDFAATTAIFNEAKGVATDIYGNALELNRKDSTLMNHKGVLFATKREIAELIMRVYKDKVL